jgi:two-component system chemotaxis response regulator CheB
MIKIRVLVVDDSAVIRSLLSDALSHDPEIEVVGLAGNGEVALQKLQSTHPDIVTLDMEMPVMDGLQTLKAIRKTHPKLPVIMFSTITERGSCATMDALALGASDYVTKPANVGSVLAGIDKIKEDLIPKIKALVRHPADSRFAHHAPATPVKIPPRTGVATHLEALVIGVSTGGPNALAELLPMLGTRFPLPILIVQHMPPLFTRLLAERIASVSGIPTREAKDRDTIRPGQILIAPGGQHMTAERSRDGVRVRLNEEPPENSCRPAVDVLFRSAASAFADRTLAVVLTGMGQDGLKGSEAIRAVGGQVLVQDEASCVVWGMPGAVFNAGLADKMLPLKELAAEIYKRIDAGNSSERSTARSLSERVGALQQVIQKREGSRSGESTAESGSGGGGIQPMGGGVSEAANNGGTGEARV